MKRALFLLLALAACGDDASTSSDSEAPSFLAFAPSFDGFHGWKSVPATSDVPSSIHTGPMTAYLNKAPAHGSKTFPVGTIIVKEVETGALPDRTVFAMVKRGAGFNGGGAVDWEWFELRNVDDKSSTIIWRGVGPPAGEKYGGDPNGCNGCHSIAKDNDFVLTTALKLETF